MKQGDEKTNNFDDTLVINVSRVKLSDLKNVKNIFITSTYFKIKT